MGEPVSLPCQVNDKHLLEKVQKKRSGREGNIILGVCGGGGGQSSRLFTSPIVMN